MPKFRTRSLAGLFALLFCLVLAGCYEDKAVVTLNADGSGSFEQTIVISEQMVVAMLSEEGDMQMSSDAPFNVTRAELEAKLGDAGVITAFEMKDLDDGGKLVTVRGTFADAGAFFGSEYASDSLKLGLELEADGRAALTWIAQDEGDQNGPSLDQVYGMAKGLNVVRRVNLPSAPAADQGKVEGNSVEWAMDLTNRDTLASTKALVEASEGGVLVARFDPGAMDLQPAAVAEAPAAIGSGGEAEAAAPIDTSGMKVVVNTVGWTRYATLGENAYPQDNVLSLDMELTWPEGSRPLAVYTGELKTLADDLGTDLVMQADEGFGQSRSDVWEHSDTETFRIEAVGPARDAKSLVGLAGHVRVVTQVNVETVSLDNPPSLVGKASTGNEALDAMGFKVKAIDGMSIELTFNEGVEANGVIQSLSVTLPDGTPVESNGWGGWANNMTYNFPQDVSAMTNLTIDILTGETVVAVPFSIDQIELP